MAQQRKWQNILVEPFVQIKMGAYVLALSLIYSTALGVFIWDAFDEQMFQFQEVYEGNSPDFIFSQGPHTAYIFALAALVAVFILIMLLLIVRRTHRMFGPMVSIERFVDSVTQGDYTQRLKLREKDDLKDLAESLNRVAAALERENAKS